MSYEASPIEQLQLDTYGRINAHPLFSDVQVFVVRPRSSGQATLIQDEINNALEGFAAKGGAIGAAVIVYMPVGKVPDEEVPGPELWLVQKVRVIENPLVNMGASGTGNSAETLMLAVLNLCHQWFFQDMCATMVADQDAFQPMEQFIPEGKIVYDLQFRIKMNLAGPAKVPMPLIQGNATAGVTISGAPGALIMYTTDGSYPGPGNSSALIYGVALEGQSGQPLQGQSDETLYGQTDPTLFPASGTLVRAVAYLPNHMASDLAAKTIQ